MKNLQLSVTVGAIDRFTGPARKIASVSATLAKKLTEGQKKMVGSGVGPGYVIEI